MPVCQSRGNDIVNTFLSADMVRRPLRGGKTDVYGILFLKAATRLSVLNTSPCNIFTPVKAAVLFAHSGYKQGNIKPALISSRVTGLPIIPVAPITTIFMDDHFSIRFYIVEGKGI